MFALVSGAIVSIDILHRILNIVQSRISAVTGARFTRMLRTRLFEKIQSLSMASVQKKSTGDLMGRINNDVNVVQNFVVHLLPTYFAQFRVPILLRCLSVSVLPECVICLMRRRKTALQ